MTKQPSIKAITTLLNGAAEERISKHKTKGVNEVEWSDAELQTLSAILQKMADKEVDWAIKDLVDNRESICPGKSKGAFKKKVTELKRVTVPTDAE